MRYAKVINGVVDVISEVDMSGQPGWEEVSDQVFGGFTKNADGTFTGFPAEVRPREATRADIRIALANLGHLAAVEAAVAQSNTAVQIAYADATSFLEDDPTCNEMASQIGFSMSAVFDEAENVAAARRGGSLL